MIDINGMAHVILTVSQYDKAKAFYARLMPAMGLECVFDGSDMTYFVARARRSASSPASRSSPASGSSRVASVCTTSASGHGHAKTSTRSTHCCGKWGPIS